MNNVKKVSLIIIGVLVLFGLVFTAMNVADGPLPHFDVAEGIDDSSFEAFAASVVGEPNFDRSNAFYRLWSLTEPEGTDIEADELLLKYRRMHDTQYDTETFTKEWNANSDNWRAGEKFTGYFQEFYKKRKEILDKFGTFDSWSGNCDRDWTQYLVEKKEGLLQLKELYRVFLERYDKLVHSPSFEEFTLVRGTITVPNLIAWLQVGRLYVAGHMLDAVEGNWEQGTAAILDHVESCKKALRGSRTLIVNLIGKALLKESLYALASLMNQPDCPKTVYELIIRSMPPLEYMEFGSRTPLLLEGYSLTRVGEGSLLYHKNRTRQYYCDFLSNLVKCDAIPPYQWESHPLEFKSKDGLLWWMQNPSGKAEYEKVVKSQPISNLFTTIYKSYAVKAVYDMTRISAELHLNYTSGKTVPQVLDSLDTYKNWLDHGSGKPYKWHEQKQILYSFGIDRDDDDGKFDRNSIDTDVSLPVVVFIK